MAVRHRVRGQQVRGNGAEARRGSALDHVRPETLAVPESGIVEIFNYGRGRQGLIPLWVGESDQGTPAFISTAAARSLEAGETFYTYQRGLPALREAIARDMTGLYEPTAPFSPERYFVTIGGMHALQIAMRIVASAGDDILVPTPAWPNFGGAIMALGARPIEVPMVLGAGSRPRWGLDMEALERVVTPRTRAVIVNSPSNPLGWTATPDELRDVLAFARRHGLWIIADEIYGRFVYGQARAPSFHDIMEADDLILFPQTLSKNWAMTGWRIGWLEAPPALGQIIENLVQYSTSGVPVPTQRAAIAAIEGGQAFVAEQVGRAATNRDLLCDAFAGTGRMRFAAPEGAFYLFCGIEGHPDARRLAFRLVDEAGIGAAPETPSGRRAPGPSGSVSPAARRRSARWRTASSAGWNGTPEAAAYSAARAW